MRMRAILPHARSSALVIGCLCASGEALGFSAQGHRWTNPPGTPVPYMLHPAGSDDVSDGSDLEAFRRAFATWQGVACAYLAFEERPWADPRAVANEGTNRIMFVESASEWPGQDATLALTYTFYTLDADRRITDADMILNGASWTWTTREEEAGTGTPAKIDLETVALHEIGHFFGLDHSQDQRAAMFPSNNKTLQRAPADDDVQGICSLYPNGELVPEGGVAPARGPVGAPCRSGEDCASSLCAEDELIMRTYCTAACSPQDPMSCPAGFACEASSAGAYCLAPAPVDELCDQCDNGGQCGSGLCVVVPNVNNNQPFCSRACDPTPGQPAQCPDGYQCILTQQQTTQVGACVPNTGICDPRGRGGHNETCFSNGSCKPGHICLEYYPQSGLNFCYGLCAVSQIGFSCGPERSLCLGAEGHMNTAACFTIAGAGAPCIPELCDSSSFCAYDENAGVDSALCYEVCPGGQGDCEANFQCTGFPGLPPLCVPNAGFKYVGEACLSDAECRTTTCRTFGQNKLCTEICSTTDSGACGPGLKCVPQPGTEQGLCWPESYTDPAARDPSRGIRELPASYCACDTTVACDEGCACDAECEGGGDACSCTSAEGKGPAPLGLAGLGWMIYCLIRSRSPRGWRRRSPKP